MPIAAAVPYPAIGVLLSPLIAAAAMSATSVCASTNARRLRLEPGALPPPLPAAGRRPDDERVPAPHAASPGEGGGSAWDCGAG